MKEKKRLPFLLLGAGSGLLNGLFGGGGGMAAVPLLRASGLSQQKANASSLGVMLPLATTTLLFGIFQNGLPDINFWPLDLAAIPGGLIGALLLPKMKDSWLRQLFGGLLVFAALRMIFFS